MSKEIKARILTTSIVRVTHSISDTVSLDTSRSIALSEKWGSCHDRHSVHYKYYLFIRKYITGVVFCRRFTWTSGRVFCLWTGKEPQPTALTTRHRTLCFLSASQQRSKWLSNSKSHLVTWNICSFVNWSVCHLLTLNVRHSVILNVRHLVILYARHLVASYVWHVHTLNASHIL